MSHANSNADTLEKISKRNTELVRRALEENAGTRQWKQYKRQSLEEILEIALGSDRIALLHADVSGDFDLVYRIKQPVPRVPRNGELVVGEFADYHLHYQEDFETEVPPPWVPLGLLYPRDPFHPNCSLKVGLRGRVCLGALFSDVTPPPKECLLAGYFALVLRDLSLDVEDPEGILNVHAVNYFLQHPEYTPLTYAGLCDPWDGWNGVVTT